ncbi:MAG: hypothetical protein HQL38_19695 [Alphaproteobacteria bacterium]|nr:hypothetical protein [Alphaproteobacteria bacterium]
MKPAFQITADQTDVTATLAGRFVSLRLTDKPGMEADELELVVSDQDGALVLPRRGVRLEVAIGWTDQALTPKGAFTVDEIAHAGPPDQVTIRARSAEFAGTLKEQREESYDETTLGAILTTIAGRQGLTPAVEPGLAAIAIEHVDQTNESDANFLTRLGQDHGALATIKDGRLLFIPVGHPTSVGGTALAPVTIRRDKTDRHDFQIADRDGSHTGVRAKWRRLGSSTTQYATAGEEGSWLTLKRDYPNEAAAQAAADAEWARVQRQRHEIRLTFAHGRPEIIANAPIRLQGWRPEIDAVQWMVGDVVHTIAGSFVTEVMATDGQPGE